MRNMNWKTILAMLVSTIVIILLNNSRVYAADLQIEKEIEEYDFDEIDETLKNIFPDEKLDFKETVMQIVSGELEFTGELFLRLLKEQTGYAFSSCKSNLIHLILIALMAALFHNFSNVFQSKQISEMSFYVLYLLMIALCLNSVQAVIDWVADGVEMITGFMSAFCPVYFVAVAAAKGSISAVAFHNLVMFLIYLVELLIGKFLLPVIHIYIMICVLNHLSEEDYLSKFSELLEVVVAWTLKTLVAGIIGLNLVQGLINPAIDSVKRSAIARGAEAIPGIGDAIGGTAEVLIATAVLIKNGIGVAGVIFCFALCIVPLVQVSVIVLMYKLSAAVIQPVSDKRIIGCIESVSEGCRLLMKVIFTISLLFLLTIVIITTLTNNV